MPPKVIVTSGPTATYPQLAYRTSLDTLLKFLDGRHGVGKWAIWEFRAEGAGYPDEVIEAAKSHVWHFPWPDHHPPPFALVPRILASMRDWLGGVEEKLGAGAGPETGAKDGDDEAERNKDDGLHSGSRSDDSGNSDRVVVLHCKAGKGRSGTVCCAYLVAEEGWKLQDALARFTQRRMRPGFGAGVSIPSQLRYLDYVEKWTQTGKVYVERRLEILEVHVWGLREGVSLAVGGFGDEGKRIDIIHRFGTDELEIIRGEAGGSNDSDSGGLARAVREVIRNSGRDKMDIGPRRSKTIATSTAVAEFEQESRTKLPAGEAPKTNAGAIERFAETDTVSASVEGRDVMYRPSKRIIIPTNDVHISLERRVMPAYGFSMITSLAHVWFNTFFEPCSPDKRHSRQAQQNQTQSSTPKSSSPGLDDFETLETASNSGISTGKGRASISYTGSSNTSGPASDAVIGNEEDYKACNKDYPAAPPVLSSLTSSPSSSGVFTIPWQALDGLKGTSRKGTRALDKLAVVWRALDPDEETLGAQGQGDVKKPVLIKQPEAGEKISDTGPVDLRTNGARSEEMAIGTEEDRVDVNDVQRPKLESAGADIVAAVDDASVAERVAVKSDVADG